MMWFYPSAQGYSQGFSNMEVINPSPARHHLPKISIICIFYVFSYQLNYVFLKYISQHGGLNNF